MVRVRRGWRERALLEQEFPLQQASAGGWQGALTLLEEKLTSPEWSQAQLQIVISNHWVRYAAVPHMPELSNAAEAEAFARGLLASTYGDALNEWVVCLSSSPPGTARVVCAMPPALLAGLRDLCARTGSKLASIQPQLIAAYNSWRHRIPDGSAWFVTVDDDSLAAARLVAGGVDRVHTVRIGRDWTRELKRLQTFGRLASSSAEDRRVYVDGPRTLRPSELMSSPDLQWLEDDDSPPATTLHRLEKLRRVSA